MLVGGIDMREAERTLAEVAELGDAVRGVGLTDEDSKLTVAAAHADGAQALWDRASAIASGAGIRVLAMELGEQEGAPEVTGRPGSAIGPARAVADRLVAAGAQDVSAGTEGGASFYAKRAGDAARVAAGADVNRLSVIWGTNPQSRLSGQPAEVARMLRGIAALEKAGRSVAYGRALTVGTPVSEADLRAIRRIGWPGKLKVEIRPGEACGYRFSSTAHGRAGAVQADDSCDVPARDVAARWNASAG